MSLGALLILVYWAVFTLRKGFTPKVLQRTKAAKYDIIHGDDEAREAAQRLLKPLQVATWALRVGGWVESILLSLVMIWLLYLVGALIAGSFVLMGYPV